jgi:hypothetical protein
MRDIVYSELADNIDAILITYDGKDRDFDFEVTKGTLDLNLSFENFEYAESQPLVFHQLREASHIRSLYAGLRSFLKTCKDRSDVLLIVKIVKEEITKNLKEGHINRKRLITDGRPNLKKYLMSL